MGLNIRFTTIRLNQLQIPEPLCDFEFLNPGWESLISGPAWSPSQVVCCEGRHNRLFTLQKPCVFNLHAADNWTSFLLTLPTPTWLCLLNEPVLYLGWNTLLRKWRNTDPNTCEDRVCIVYFYPCILICSVSLSTMLFISQEVPIFKSEKYKRIKHICAYWGSLCFQR